MTSGSSSSNRSFKLLSWAEAKEAKIIRVEDKCFMVEKGTVMEKSQGLDYNEGKLLIWLKRIKKGESLSGNSREASATRNDYARRGGPLAQMEMAFRPNQTLSRSSRDT